MESSLYFGEVRHQRKSPKKHAFRYRVFMAHLFLDELREVFKKLIVFTPGISTGY